MTPRQREDTNNKMLIKNDDPLLHRASQAVNEEMFLENGAALKPIAAMLMKCINDNDALGVSACQIGMDLAIFAMNTNGRPRICANPQIVAASAEMCKAEEGCLSYPGLVLKVNRPAEVVVRYHDIDGNEVTEHLEGTEARVWLHEYDHTIGICFVDRVGKMSIDMAKRRMKKMMRKGSRK